MQLYKTMLKNFSPRLYQQKILNTAVQKNTLVVLPTGLGKTAVAMMLACHRLRLYPDSKIVMLAPTKPLVDQHKRSFLKYMDIDPERVAVFTGSISPQKRAELWPKLQIVFTTPQGLENDLLGDKLSFTDVSLLIVDEAHRGVGDYSYVYVAKTYMNRSDFPKILALTASPGSDIEKIEEVCDNFFIDDVEVRTEEDPDVKPYVHDIEAEYVSVELPKAFAAARKYLVTCFKSKVADLKKSEFKIDAKPTKKQLLGLQREILADLRAGERDYEMYRGLSMISQAIKVEHALENLESQGVTVCANYMERLFADAAKGKVKAAKNLAKDTQFRLAHHKIQELQEQGTEHPKFAILRDIVQEALHTNPTGKLIVFSQYRDTASKIVSEIKSVSKPKLFVGQQKKRGTGLTQKEQIAVLDDFRAGVFNVLVATSVAEEGLDIPQVDMVVFYEPIPSAIRHIQRRGRTGRQQKGALKVLVAKGTRDEAYRWTAFYKEKRMRSYFKEIKGVGLKLRKKAQPTLAQYLPDQKAVQIFVDYREKSSGVVKELAELGVTVKLEMLDAADYLLSSKVGVEFKTVEDFVNSIVDGRLLPQLRTLKTKFERPIIVLEGTQDIYSVRQMHRNSINGMLATIAVSYGIPILWTKNPKETASLLVTIAKREQTDAKSLPQLHFEKRISTLAEMQEYLVSSFPNVGVALARELLKHFGSVRKIMDASVEELQHVEGVGKKKAEKIKEIIDATY